jgi:hypothetical protein
MFNPNNCPDRKSAMNYRFSSLVLFVLCILFTVAFVFFMQHPTVLQNIFFKAV